MSNGIPLGRARVAAEQAERVQRELPEEEEVELGETATATLFPILTNAQAALLSAAVLSHGITFETAKLAATADDLLFWLDQKDLDRLEVTDDHS